LKLNSTRTTGQQTQAVQSLTRRFLFPHLRVPGSHGIGLLFRLKVPAVLLKSGPNALIVPQELKRNLHDSSSAKPKQLIKERGIFTGRSKAGML
jgi:hypothetical protein